PPRMRVAPTTFGFDSIGPPNTGASQAMLQWVLEHTNLRIAGGYTSLAAWHGMLEPVWLQGFGLSLFDNSARQATAWLEESRNGGQTWTAPRGRPAPPSRGDGEATAAAIVQHARTEAPNLTLAVIFI